MFVFNYASFLYWNKNLFDNGFYQMDWNFTHNANISFDVRLVCVTKKIIRKVRHEINSTSKKILGFFWLPRLKQSIARQDTDCERETVTFNSSFFEFMVAFLGVDQSECACEDPCPASVAKYVKLYLYRKYVS